MSKLKNTLNPVLFLKHTTQFTQSLDTPVRKAGVWTRWSQVVVVVLPSLGRETGEPALSASGTVLFSRSVRWPLLGMPFQTARWGLGGTTYPRPLAGRTQRGGSVVDMVSNTLYRGQLATVLIPRAAPFHTP